jgi:hypothetical protein
LSVVGCACSHSCVQLDIKSQLVIVHLRRLEETADLHGSLALLLLGRRGSLLTLFGVQLSVVTGELFQGDQEVSQDDFETVEVGVGSEQSIDEGSDLGTRISQ